MCAKDGFYAAELGPDYDDVRAIFRVREDADPLQCAREKDLGEFTRLAAAREEDVETWLAGHPVYRPVAAPTAKQLRLLRRLAIERGQTFPTPATRAQASRAIARLKARQASSRTERAVDREQVSRDLAVSARWARRDEAQR
jgi:hypothetical protein